MNTSGPAMLPLSSSHGGSVVYTTVRRPRTPRTAAASPCRYCLSLPHMPYSLAICGYSTPRLGH